MAIIRKIEEVPLEMMDCLDHGNGLGLRILLDPLLNLGIEGLTMVQTEITPGGYTVFHQHAFEQVHVIYEGESLVETEDNQYIIRSPTVLAFPPGVKHRQKNIGRNILKLIELSVPPTPKEFWQKLGYFKDR
jgi:quercetin dioxygenase-like cupin family protein